MDVIKQEVVFPGIESFMSESQIADFNCSNFSISESAEWYSDEQDFTSACDYQEDEID